MKTFARRKIAALWALVFFLSTQAFAASTWTQEVGYWDRLQGKTVFGMGNFWGGWISLIYQPLKAKEEGKSIALGIGKGIVYAPALTLGGLFHFWTAPLTFLDLPLPENGVDLQ